MKPNGRAPVCGTGISGSDSHHTPQDLRNTMNRSELVLLQTKRKKLHVMAERGGGAAVEAAAILADQLVKSAEECITLHSQGKLVGELAPVFIRAEEFMLRAIAIIKEHTSSDIELARKINDIANEQIAILETV